MDQQKLERLGLLASFMDIADQDPENIPNAPTEWLPKDTPWDEVKVLRYRTCRLVHFATVDFMSPGVGFSYSASREECMTSP